jgi:hypothetical protein
VIVRALSGPTLLRSAATASAVDHRQILSEKADVWQPWGKGSSYGSTVWATGP